MWLMDPVAVIVDAGDEDDSPADMEDSIDEELS